MPSRNLPAAQVEWELCRRGFSIVGARQLLAGDVVTSPADRLALARLVAAVVEHDETHWVGHDVVGRDR